MMPDHIPSTENEEDYFPWDCDGGISDFEGDDYEGWGGIDDGED